MARKELVHIEVWEPDRSAQRMDVPADLSVGCQRADVHKVLMKTDKLGLRFVPGYKPIREFQLRPRDIVRLVFADGSLWEYRVKNPAQEFSGTRQPDVEAEALWRDLAEHACVRSYASGRKDVTFSLLAKTPLEALTQIMDAAPSYFVVGDLSGLTATQQSKLVYLTIDGHSVLEAIEYLADEVGCEWGGTYNSASDNYEVYLTEQVGTAGNRTVGFTDDGKVLLRMQQQRQRTSEDYASHIVGVLVDEDGDRSISEATWQVEAGSGTTSLTLGPGTPLAFDGHLVGLYFGNETDGWREVTGSDAAASTISLTSAFSGSEGRFALDAAGTWPVGLPTEAVPSYGRSDRVERIQGSAFENYVEESGIAALMETFAGGFATGWSGVEGASSVQSADERFVGHGSNTMRVTANKGQGIISDPIDIQGATQLALWMSCGLESGAIRVEVVDGGGGVHPPDNPKPFSNETGRLLALEMEGVLNNLTGPVHIQVLAVADGTVFHLDAVTLVGSPYPRPWEPVMGPRAAWLELVEVIKRDGNSVFDELTGRSFDGSWIDLSGRGTYSMDEFELGAVVRVRDGDKSEGGGWHVNFDTRFVELRYDLLRPHDKQFTLEKKRADLVDFLTAQNNKRDTLPAQPPRPPVKPRLLVERLDGLDEVTFEFSVVKGASNERLSNYTVFLDWTLDEGVWTRNTDGSFDEWVTEEDSPYPHAATFVRPASGQFEVRAYAQDETTGLRTPITVLPVPSAALLLSVEPVQNADGTGTIEIDVYDPFLAVTSIDVAWKLATSDVFGAYAAEPGAPGAGELGTVGADTDLFRLATEGLHPKHNLHYKVRVGYSLDGATGYVYAAGSFDRDRRAEIEWATSFIDSNGDAQGEAHADEDTAAIAWASSTVSPAAIDDAAFDAAITAGDYVNSRDAAAILMAGVPNSIVYTKWRPFKTTDPADGTDQNGPDFLSVASPGTDTILPHVRVDKWQQGGFGYLQLEIHDPNGLVTEVRVKKAPGRDFDGMELWAVLSDLGGYYESTVALFEKHPSFILFEIELDGGAITPISDVVQFDFKHVANVVGQPDLDHDPATGDVTAIGRVDEDAAAVAWAVVADLDGDYDADFAAAISAGQFANTGDRFEEVVASGVAEGDVKNIVFRPFDAGLTTGSSATSGNGPDVETTIRIPTADQRPSFKVEMDQVGSVGSLYVDILDDPAGLVGSVEFRKASGRNLLASDTWSAGTQSGSEWHADVALTEGHDSYVQYRIVLTGGYDPIYGDPVPFDADEIPRAGFQFNYEWNGSGFDVTLNWMGYEDTDSVEIDRNSPNLSSLIEEGRTGQVAVFTGQPPGMTIDFRARGWSGAAATGNSGEWQDFAFTLPTEAPGVDASNVFGLEDADAVVEAARDWAFDGTFSTSGQTLSWASGTLEWKGTSVPISAGNVSLPTLGTTYFVFFDPDNPGLDFQTTTSKSTATLGNRFVVCIGWRSTDGSEDASFSPAFGALNEQPVASFDYLNANVLAAVRANVAVLSAITAYLGNVILDATGSITNTDTEFILDADGYWMDNIGDVAGARIEWGDADLKLWSTAAGQGFVKAASSLFLEGVFSEMSLNATGIEARPAGGPFRILLNHLELGTIPGGPPGTPASNIMAVYPKTDGKLYAKNWSGTEYDLTSSGGGGGMSELADDLTPQLGGDLDTNFNDVLFRDDDELLFGDDDDIVLLYDEGDEAFEIALNVPNAEANFLRVVDDLGNLLAKITQTAVALYYQGDKQLETTSDGVDVSGTLDVSGHFNLGGNIYKGGNFGIRGEGSNDSLIEMKLGAEVELYYNAVSKLETHSDGVRINGGLGVDQNPTSDGQIRCDEVYRPVGSLLIAGQGVTIQQAGEYLGFFGDQGSQQRTVTGSTADEKIDSLIAALSTYYNLVVDGTT